MGEPTILCLHGLGRSGSDWDGVRDGLGRFGRVSAPDLPRASADDLTAMLPGLPEASIVIGHSLGGVLALRLAELRPDVRAVVLSDSFFPIVRGARSRRAAVWSYASHRAALARELAARDARPRPRRSTARALRSLVRIGFGAEAFHATAARIGAPVLVLHGGEDHHVPVEFAIAAAARHPGWELRILEDAGHDPHVAQPDRWLSGVAGWLGGLPLLADTATVERC